MIHFWCFYSGQKYLSFSYYLKSPKFIEIRIQLGNHLLYIYLFSIQCFLFYAAHPTGSRFRLTKVNSKYRTGNIFLDNIFFGSGILPVSKRQGKKSFSKFKRNCKFLCKYTGFMHHLYVTWPHVLILFLILIMIYIIPHNKQYHNNFIYLLP